MKPYKNVDDDSGIDAYETGPGFIRIRLEDGSVYLYTNVSTGSDKIIRVKSLADAGNSLCTFINTSVRNAYALKER